MWWFVVENNSCIDPTNIADFIGYFLQVNLPSYVILCSADTMWAWPWWKKVIQAKWLCSMQIDMTLHACMEMMGFKTDQECTGLIMSWQWSFTLICTVLMFDILCNVTCIFNQHWSGRGGGGEVFNPCKYGYNLVRFCNPLYPWCVEHATWGLNPWYKWYVCYYIRGLISSISFHHYLSLYGGWSIFLF